MGDTPVLKDDVADLKARLAAFEGRLAGLTAVVELRHEMRNRYESLGQELGARIDTLDPRVSARMEALSSNLIGRIDALEAGLTSRMDGLRSQLTMITWLLGTTVVMMATGTVALVRLAFM